MSNPINPLSCLGLAVLVMLPACSRRSTVSGDSAMQAPHSEPQSVSREAPRSAPEAAPASQPSEQRSHLGNEEEDVEDGSGITPLMSAAKAGDGSKIARLLQHGADPNHRSAKQQSTPLELAVISMQRPAVQALLDGGAQVNARPYALIRAAEQLHMGGEDPTEIVLLLLRSGAKANVRDEEHNTPLLFAVLNGNRRVVEALLAAGARPGAKNFSGLTPLNSARDPELRRLLEAAGGAGESGDEGEE